MNVFLDYLASEGERLLDATIAHAALVLIAVALSTVIGVTLGVLTYRTDRPRRIVLGVAGIFLTIPSFALFGLMIAPLGLGVTPAIVALVMYGLLPIIRNTIVGLRSVDSAVVESAQGMGMGRVRRLIRIELPLAWPVIITGMRVSAVILVGIAAIAAVINGPGLGDYIFKGLARLGSPNAIPSVLSAIIGIIIIASTIDFGFLVLSRLTTSRGIRA